MKILVLSDSHHNEAELEQILKNNARSCCAIFHLGDGCDDMLAMTEFTSGIPVYIVKGNCDRYSPFDPCEKIITTVAGKKIFACHGHRYNVKYGLGTVHYAALEQNADICLYGHTHSRRLDDDGEMKLINPGSVFNGEFAIIEIDGDKTEVTFFS